MTEKVAVIVNPVSANGKTARRWPEIESRLREIWPDLEHHFTAGPGEATALARRALEGGAGLVIAVGGDGTANEVVNGFFHEDGRPVSPEAAISFIATGTGSDLVRTLGIPRDPREAIAHLARSGRRQVDLGRVSFIEHRGLKASRYFVNIAGLGLDGDTVARVNRTTKIFGGFVSFLWGTVVSLILYRNQVMAVEVDGKEVCDGPVTMLAAGNGQYFGGGMQVAPKAVMEDGLLDIIILHGLGKLDLLANLPRVYRGTHLTHPRIESLRGRRVTVTSPGTALLDLDGEQPGRAPVEIEILPSALTVQG